MNFEPHSVVALARKALLASKEAALLAEDSKLLDDSHFPKYVPLSVLIISLFIFTPASSISIIFGIFIILLFPYFSFLSFLLLLAVSYASIFLLSCFWYCSCLHKCCVFCILWAEGLSTWQGRGKVHTLYPPRILLVFLLMFSFWQLSSIFITYLLSDWFSVSYPRIWLMINWKSNVQ